MNFSSRYLHELSAHRTYLALPAINAAATAALYCPDLAHEERSFPMKKPLSTVKLLAAGNASIQAATAWYLSDLGEFRGKQELYTRQSPPGPPHSDGI